MKPNLDAAMLLIGRSIGDNSRRKYQSAMNGYNKYYATRADSPNGAITLEHTLQWLASLAGTVAPSTIAAYKSALSTTYLNSPAALTSSVNPLDHPSLTRLLEGIQHAYYKPEQRRKMLAPVTDAVTFDMLMKLVPIWQDASTFEQMLLAAAFLCTAAILRPSELLGSARFPSRALRIDQVTFYRDAAGSEPIYAGQHDVQLSSAVLVRNRASIAQPVSIDVMPHHALIELDISKTANYKRPPLSAIAQPDAIRILWHWIAHRRAHPDDTNRIFVHDGKQLTMKQLFTATQSALAGLGHDRLHLTGKCFRRGAASSLAAAGVAPADISVAGRWEPNGLQYQTYVDAGSQLARQIAINQKMGNHLATS